MSHRRSLPSRWALGTLALLTATAVQAQGTGISAKGNTGGLVIPSAWVLDPGTMAITAGNYMEPRIPNPDKRQNYSFGVGFLPYLEIFGRFAEYQYDGPSRPGLNINGPRDLSANVKFQFPSLHERLPDFAIGINDIGGAANYFDAAYAVASDQWGPVRWSLGYARGKASGNRGKLFDGPFGGVEVMAWDTGLSLLAEYDGQQGHAGVRYYAPPIPFLGNAQFVGTAQRSFGAEDAQGNRVDATSVALSLMIPFGRNQQAYRDFEPGAGTALPPLDTAAEEAAAEAPFNPEEARTRLANLLQALEQSGLERLRVGLAGETQLVVEYENHRYARNEVDALGIVLGLAAEYAPRQVKRVYAVTLKNGQRQYETSVSAPRMRAFLRDGNWGPVRGTLWTGMKPSYEASAVNWLHDKPTGHTWVRLSVAPRISSYLGTEVGAYDYSLAAEWQAQVPLWRGAVGYASYITPLADSDNFREGGVFYPSRQRPGTRAAHVSQALWLHPRLLNVLSVGQFNYNYGGAQNQTYFFVPGRDADTVNLKLSRFRHFNDTPQYPDESNYSLSYTLRMNDGNTAIEAGFSEFVDGSRGPTLNITRWFGDVNVQLHARRNDGVTTAGLRVGIPLTPRRGMQPYPITFAGTSQFEYGIETAVASSGANRVTRGGNSIAMDYDATTQLLNRGRFGEDYLGNQLPRMREAFYQYTR